ncbi:VWA domain-containing protein [Paenibacillus lautus]|uniref:VWA domain-containing protein n=1 Tax=Paenibacillus lautus TaxID=1401 RepID=UPI003D2826F6
MFRRSIFICMMLIFLLAGCRDETDKGALKIPDSSDSAQSNEPEKDPSKIQTPSDSDQSEPSSEIQSPPDSSQTPLTDEEILMKPPGRFAGSNYNEQKVQAALDELPSEMTADQYTEELLLLLAEDYRSYITTFKEYDTEVKVDNERPNGNITLPASRKLHISILLDASGSMKAQINGKSKMDSAKEAIQIFVDKLPENAEVSLRVYGHKGTGSQKDKQVSCNSTEEIFHGQGNQTDQMKTALQSVKPAGWTPIANALKSVKQDIDPETTDSVVYVVSDGIETCGGNPVQIAKELNQSKVKTVVNIIGFDVDNEGQKLLRQVATSGGGEFTSVDNDESLKNYLNKAYIKLLGEWKTWQAKGEGQANTQKEQKQGAINNTEMDMQILANKEYYNLLAALKHLETKYGNAIPHGEIWMQITNRKNFAWNYARDTGRRLYDEVTKSGNQVYDDIKNEGDKNIEDLENKQNN